MIDQQPVTTFSASSLNRDSATSVDILKLLDKLEELVEDSRQICGRAIWVNVDEFFVHTNKIRAFLPDEMKRASRLSQDNERMIEETRDEVVRTMESVQVEAERRLSEADQQARHLVNSHEIKRRAEEQASLILQHAEEQAAAIKGGADQYAKEVLASLDGFLGRIMGTISRGREKLEQREGFPAP